MATSYKLTYFNARGAAEVCRFIFAQAGVKYEDKRVEREEWPKLKPNTPTGQLPMLEVDGKTLTGSGPIARYLGEKYGLAGSNDFENAQIAGILDFLQDFRKKMVATYFEKDEERKAKLQKALVEEDIPNFWGIFEKWIQANNSDKGWIFGNNPTYADFSIYCVLDYLIKGNPNFLDSYPGVAKLRKSVENLPNIAKWLEERPKTEH